jgi:hypothetical protein
MNRKERKKREESSSVAAVVAINNKKELWFLHIRSTWQISCIFCFLIETQGIKIKMTEEYEPLPSWMRYMPRKFTKRSSDVPVHLTDTSIRTSVVIEPSNAFSPMTTRAQAVHKRRKDGSKVGDHSFPLAVAPANVDHTDSNERSRKKQRMSSTSNVDEAAMLLSFAKLTKPDR